MDERAYGTAGLGGQGLLRGAFRGRLEAGRRVGLGNVEKGVPSRAYRGVPEESEEGVGNLTNGLTLDLTSRLTDHLTHGLTKSRVRGWERVANAVRRQLEAGDGARSLQTPSPS